MATLDPRAVAVAARDRFDRFRHPTRRAHSLSRLATIQPESILIVCLGNICRSPYAAHALQARVAPSIAVTSSGFIGPGRPPPDEALTAARPRGVEHADHRSVQTTTKSLADADLVVIFDRFHVARLKSVGFRDFARCVWLGDFDPVWTGKRAIIDPWGRGQAAFDSTFERIDRCLDEMARVLGDRPG